MTTETTPTAEELLTLARARLRAFMDDPGIEARERIRAVVALEQSARAEVLALHAEGNSNDRSAEEQAALLNDPDYLYALRIELDARIAAHEERERVLPAAKAGPQ